MVCGPLSAEKANRHEERTASRGSVPLHPRRKKQMAQFLARDPGPTSRTPWVPVPGCEEGEPPHAPVLRLLEAVAEDREGNFSNQCSGIEVPRAWPSKTIMRGGRGSVSRGDRRGSWRARRWTCSDYVSKRLEAVCQSPAKLWP
jgi:hypothetical protein